MGRYGSSRSSASRRTPSAPLSRSDPNAARGAERPFAAAVAMRIRGAFDVLVHVPSIVPTAQPYGQVLVQLHIPIRRVASVAHSRRIRRRGRLRSGPRCEGQGGRCLNANPVAEAAAEAGAAVR